MDELPEGILRCPVSEVGLRKMTDAEVGQANMLLSRGMLRRLNGSPVTKQIRAGFASADGRLGYVIEDGIAMLLASSAIVIDERRGENAQGKTLGPEKEAVRVFYDEVGWQRDEHDVYVDTARFVDLRPIVQDYLQECRLRVKRHLVSSGEYVLDVASGPVPPSTLVYSDGFDIRICVDLSVVALKAARETVGERGIYIVGDITNLPFRDDSIDAVVSLHTIYHVPRDEQDKAFREIHRVLKPGSSGVVVYTWPRGFCRERSTAVRNALVSSQVIRRATRLARVGAGRQRSVKKRDAESYEPELYFYAHDYSWFSAQNWPFALEILVWRSLGTDFLRKWIRPKMLGRPILGLVYRVEERFPHLAGRLGRYPMFVIRKP